MNKILAVIIEDEKPAARLLKSMIERVRPDWSVAVIAGNIKDAVQWFSQNAHPDLIFLDIHLSDGNSFDFLSKAQPTSSIIFTTAYDEYAIQAFRVNSIDYILKPIHQERLLDAIEKYESSYHRSIIAQQEYLSNILEGISLPDKKRYRTRFLIAGIDKYTTLQIDDVAYFYSENRITTVVTHQGKELVVDFTLNKLCEQLDPNKFFRPNRQFIISIDSVKKIEPYFNNKLTVTIVPASKTMVTVSREKLTSFKTWLNY
ncbi:MAG: LytR/AlgR family response regulator transcription factor [Bacteroidales bacterium]